MAGLAAGISYFLTDNRIRVTENVEFFSRQITDNANGKTRTREGLTVDKKIGQIKLSSDLSYLVLKKTAKGFDNALKAYVLGKSAHIVVALYGRRLAVTRFDNIGINGSLSKKCRSADLCRLLVKGFDKKTSDYFSLLFRLPNTLKLAKEFFRCVDSDKIKIAFCEYFLDFVALVFTHKSVVDKYAGELSGNCL